MKSKSRIDLKKRLLSKIFYRKKLSQGEAKAGALYAVAALGIVALFGTVATGGIYPTLLKHSVPTDSPLYTCCDSGDGAACKPNQEKTVTYNGDTYALLKSGSADDGGEHSHLVITNQFAPDGRRIFISNSDSMDLAKRNEDKGKKLPPSCKPGLDKIVIDDPKRDNETSACHGIPNEMLIYVCNDTKDVCDKRVHPAGAPFDVYYRINDGPVPYEISTLCRKPHAEDMANYQPPTGQQIINQPTPKGEKNLQLETFGVKENKGVYRWQSPWCKPAIYLYPQQKTQVQVQVAPRGKFMLTIPQYPQEGWDVTAYPDGKILSGNKTYPYLYWEASIPDKLITEPKEGYMVKYNELAALFTSILPQMGLNGNETTAFREYWVKVLPESPYYFVGVIPEKQIDALAPLTIQPTPDSVLRVSLYFKALEKPMSVTAPKLSGFTRQGFTVTEWGGLFKADKNHSGFTCVM